MLSSSPNASLVCPYCSALKSLVLSLVKGVDAGVVSPPELIHGLALKSRGFCIKVVTEAGFITKNS